MPKLDQVEAVERAQILLMEAIRESEIEEYPHEIYLQM